MEDVRAEIAEPSRIEEGVLPVLEEKDYHALGEDSVKATLFEAMQTKDSVAELIDDIERLLQDVLAQMEEKESLQLEAPAEDAGSQE